MTASGYLSPGGILREPNEPDACSRRRGVVQGRRDPRTRRAERRHRRAYNAYLQRNADSAYANDRDSLDAYGATGPGPVRAPTTVASTALWTC